MTFEKFFNIIENKNGAALLLSLVILLLVTIVGIAAIDNSVFNLKSAGAGKDISKFSYRGEAIAYKACSLIWDEDNAKLKTFAPGWIVGKQKFKQMAISCGYGNIESPSLMKSDDLIDMFDKIENGDSCVSGVSFKTNLGSSIFGGDWDSSVEKSQVVCFYDGTSGSADISGGHTLHEYIVFARYKNSQEGEVAQKIFEMGYRKKY
ncbi:MAG: hypothetical protein CSA18_03340 [Deltaproteobacteria bacterium]|nr:MAG: hypothetical protein CSA18_03340 [Deltaproteobacteria bacterium]